MTTLATLPSATHTPAAPDECSYPGCRLPIAAAVRFHGLHGHTHYCNPHTAIAREWYDVAETAPLPCPWAHGAVWLADPPELA